MPEFKRLVIRFFNDVHAIRMALDEQRYLGRMTHGSYTPRIDNPDPSFLARLFSWPTE